MHPDLVSFDTDLSAGTVSGRYIHIPVPMLFKAGEYPDRQFTLSPLELASAVADFKQPIKLDLEHKPSVFDGQLGHLASLKLNPDSVTFGGHIALPVWLDKVLPPEKRKLSVSFDRKTKKVIGCSLTYKPRIEEAVFNRDAFASFAEDMAANGAPPEPPPSTPPPPPLPGGGECKQGKELAQDLHDTLAKSLESANKSPGVFDKKYITTLEKIMVMVKSLGAEGDAGGDTGGDKEKPDETTMVNNPTFSSAEQHLQLEIATLKTKIAAQEKSSQEDRQKAIGNEAVAFADKCIRVDFVASPVEKASIITGYVKAATSDLAFFSATGKNSDVLDAFKAVFASRPPNPAFKELLPPDPEQHNARQLPVDFSVGNGGNGKQPMSPDRRRQLLACTNAGQSVLAELKKQGRL